METTDMHEYRKALIHHGKCHELLTKGVRGGDSSDAFLRASVVPGIYEHFKSTPEKRKYYLVLGVAEDVNAEGKELGDGAYYVEYMALYPPHTFEKAKRILTGPDGFLMPIDRPGYKGARFRFIEPFDIGSALRPHVAEYLTH